MTILFMALILAILLTTGLPSAPTLPRRRRRLLPFLGLVALAIGAATGPALAAETVSTARSWVAVVLDFLASEAGYLLLSAIGAAGLAELRRRGVNSTILAAVESGAGVAYSRIVRSGQPVTAPGVLAGALVEGVAYTRDRVPGYLRKRKIDTEALHNMVDAKLGSLLARDPMLSVQLPLPGDGQPVLFPNGQTFPPS